jgi:uncharacterized protein (DUF58 family)
MRRALGVFTAGALLLLTAFLFAAVPLFVVAVALIALGLGVPAYLLLAARGAAIERRQLPARVLEGEEVEPAVALRRGPLGLPGAAVHDPLTRDPTSYRRRGLHRIAPPELELSDPLGLAAVRKRSAGAEQRLLVLPRTGPVRWIATGGGRRHAAGRSRASAEPFAAVDVDGLRPYRRGTPASRIHWPALARGAGLLERRLQSDGEELPLIVLDCRGEDPDLLDDAVRACASLTLELGRRRGVRVLLPADRRPVVVGTDLGAWPAVHARLALVGGGGHAPAVSQRLGARGAAGVIWVADRRPRRLAAVSVLVLPEALAAPAPAQPSFSVSGCRGFLLEARMRRQAA